MKLPYVIQIHRLADVLNGLLAEHKGRSLDVATAYFTVGGFGLVKEGLLDLGSFRLSLAPSRPPARKSVSGPILWSASRLGPPRAIGLSSRLDAQRFTKQVN
ncbi:MAG: hypothetical protein ACE5JU_14910 [Candidatus Binatia bacterium]